MFFRPTFRLALQTGLLFCAGVGTHRLAAQPTGGQVIHGAVTFSASPGLLTLQQTTGRAIINWQDFSVAEGATVRIVHSDATAATLNRVISDLPTRLMGTLEANGRVFLINPNGVLIGSGARIDTGSFLASTLDVANAEFLAGEDLNFSGPSTAGITNLGAINALEGDVFLIARSVENHGAIAARGSAGAAAGSEILVATGSGERLFVQAASLPGSIVNAGAIKAAAAELKAAGGNTYALAINNTGLVRATGTEVRQGQTWLVASGAGTVANSGTVDVSSTNGHAGRAVLTGGRILLETGSALNATGATGGGEVLVGGGWQGGDATVRNASAVVMQPGASIDVSATSLGDAGTAVLWSQEFTDFSGHIAARGGASGGTGGQVETSSAGVLQAVGKVDITSAGGASGHWLLDPWDVSIVSDAASGTAFANPFSPTAASSILASSLETALNSGANVSISTGTTGTASGIINVNAPISWTANSTLSLTAFTSIRVNASITATGATAGLVLSPNTPSNMFGGTFTLNNRASITLSGATPTLSIGGLSYTVINQLGAEGDATTAPGTASLQGLAAAANLSGRFALGSNIDATASAAWNSNAGFKPIGAPGSAFSGTLDGLGHTISGLTMVRPTETNVGLFGYTNMQARLQNIGVVDVSLLGKTSVGGLVGYNLGAIDRSYVTGSVSGPGGHLFTSDRVGGLAGTNAGAIRTSYSTATVSGTTNVGGLVGFNGENLGSGHNGFDAATTGSIEESYATGDVSGQTAVGGLVGASDAYSSIESVSSIKYVYATGAVTGTTNVGGVIGSNKDTALTESYATGSVTGTTNVGGLAGSNEASKPELTSETIGIYSSYWNTDTTGQSAAVGLESGQTQYSAGRTTAEMKQMASFPAFASIANVGGSGARWRIYEGQTTPWLMAFLYPYTVTANNDSRTYDGTAYSGGNGTTASLAIPNPGPSGTLAFGGTAQSAVNAGTYSIVPSGLWSLQQGTDISYVNGTLTINPANLTLAGTRVYDGSTTFGGAFLTATGVGGQTFTVTGAGQSGNLATKNVQSNQLLTSVGGLTLGTSSNGGLASNYNGLSTVGSSVSVTPLALTITGFAANNKVYDGTTAAVVATPGTLAGVVTGDTVGFAHTGATFAAKNVGTGIAVTLNGVALTGSGDQTNYSYTAVTTDLSDITPATLTYTADLVSRLYGAVNPPLGGTVTGFVAGETLASATTGTAQFTTTAVATTPVGTQAILGSGLTANNGNYNFVQAASNATALTINPAPLTVTADNKSRAANTANPTLTASYTGFVNGETSALVSGLALSTTAVLSSPSGNYPITAQGATAPNYTLTFVDGILAVDVGTNLLTITANNLAKLYGAALPTFTATFAGFVNGDTSSIVTGLQFATSATASSNVGTYVITPFGASAPGYSLAYVAGLLTINPAALTITALDATRSFGAPNPSLGVTYSGFVNGDTQAVVNGLTVSTSATPASTPGAYPIVPSGALASNYQIQFVPGTLSIGPLLLTITADDKTKLYGAALPEFTATYTGLLEGDTAASITGLQFSTTATAGSHVGTYTITPFGATSSIYSLAYVPGTLLINPAALTITAANATRLYGAANPAFSASFAGLVNGDTAAVVSGLTLSTPATTASPVGSYAITPANAAAADYTISYVPGLLGVTPAPLTITANSATRIYGATNPVFTGVFNGLVNGDTSASVSGLVFSSTATAGSNVGSYPIVPSGAIAANYTLTFVPGTLLVNRATLTLTANDATREVGAANPVFTGTFTGFVNGDTPGVVTGTTFSTPASVSSPVGNYAITPANASAANYTLVFVDGTLRLLPPTVLVGDVSIPVVTVGGQPAETDSEAVVEQGGRRILVSLDAEKDEPSVDETLAQTLDEAIDTPAGNSATSSSNGADFDRVRVEGTNLGNFEFVASGGGGGSMPPAVGERGLYRESSVNMGGFNVIYHEPVETAREQAEGNRALGSSYREFTDDENPQLNLVRMKVERKRAEPASGGGQGGPS